MSTPAEIRRYRVNPVEIIILATISAVFVNSIYNLFYDSTGFHPNALKEMAQNPLSEGRSPASVSTAFQSLDVSCKDNPERTIQASKIRLSGALCKKTPEGDESNKSNASNEINQAGENDPMVRAAVLNETNKFSATVFMDNASGKFSTDYIPLNAGKNQVKVEFTYKSGKIMTQNLAIMKY